MKDKKAEVLGDGLTSWEDPKLHNHKPGGHAGHTGLWFDGPGLTALAEEEVCNCYMIYSLHVKYCHLNNCT